MPGTASRDTVGMPRNPMPDHDNSYKLLFSHQEMVRDLLVGFVQEPWLAEIDFSTLEKVNGSYVTDDLRSREDDVIWRVRFKDRWLYLYILLEFQSSVDAYMALRVMTYLGLLYQDILRQGQQPAGQKLPPVLPIVLYNGQPRWTAATDIAQLIEPPPGKLRDYTPQLRYLLLDEGAIDESAPLALKKLTAALFRLEKSRDSSNLKTTWTSLLDWLREPEQSSLRRAFIVWLYRVFSPRHPLGIELPDLSTLLENETMLAESVEKWTEQWEMKGRVEGEVAVLARQLTKRFGPLDEQTTVRLKAATLDQLDIWADRILDAPTLQAVFEGH